MKEKYYIQSYGCQMNERDTETLSGILCDMGYSSAEQMTDSDIIIIHTCCVRESAENKIFGKIGELKHLKNKKGNLIIGVSGCMVQQPDAAEKLRQRAPHIDIIFGTHNLHQLPELIHQVKEYDQQITSVWDEEGEIVEDLPATRKNKVKAFVNVSYGCDNFCTYCIVPYVRGRERSRKPDDILKEVNQLAAEGFKEVMLLGQNVNSYGKDLDNKVSFAQLLDYLEDKSKIDWIRFMTSHPRDFNRDIVDVMIGSTKLCNHIHLPIQSGSNSILKKMNRGYTREEFIELMSIIKKDLPDASITTDIIVGFPGETDNDFKDTLNLVETVKFDAAYTFLYSKRSGTPAAELKEQIPDQVKKERLQQLLNVQNKISSEINKNLENQVVEVLVEGVSKNNENMFTGRTTTNKVVSFPGDLSMIGEIIKVKIIKAKTWSLDGQIN